MLAVKGIYKDGKIKESDEDFFNKDEKSESYYLMKMQQHSGYIQALLNDPDEDVWDDL